ncbi:MAG: hypothetical protein K2N55_07175 [Lachnospiraceae bacterium]|nr:hypothetical protein [Lachnospiraceae bacterium]
MDSGRIGRQLSGAVNTAGTAFRADGARYCFKARLQNRISLTKWLYMLQGERVGAKRHPA